MVAIKSVLIEGGHAYGKDKWEDDCQ
jgi:hypothetical protein